MSYSKSLHKPNCIMTKYLASVTLFVSSIFIPSTMLGDAGLVPDNVKVGRSLEVVAHVVLSERNKGAVDITVTSDNPELILLSATPEAAGTRSVMVRVFPGLRQSAEFYIQGRADSGTATYTASAPGFAGGTGTVTLGPSGFVFSAPAALTTGPDSFATSSDAPALNLRLFPALLDASFNVVNRQLVAGGSPVTIDVKSSAPSVGAFATSKFVLPAGSNSVILPFHPAGQGTTTLTASAPSGFSVPAKLGTLSATVMLPGLGMTSETVIGKDLMVCDAIALGSAAASGGLAVTLTSDNPQLLLATTGTEKGQPSITVTVPAGSNRGSYCLQAFAETGTAKVTATAPGRRNRVESVQMTPSGILMGYIEAPDEAEYYRVESAKREHGIVTSLAAGPVYFDMYPAQLDPITHRGADFTVQSLRPGILPSVEIKSSDPTVGTILSPVLLRGTHVRTQFTPLTPGTTIVSFTAPPGFTTPGNVTSFTVVVVK